MRAPKRTDFALNPTRCFVAYDSRTGDVLHVHEFVSEPGACGGIEQVWDPKAVRQTVARDFEQLKLKVLEVPRGMEPKDGYYYRVDLGTQTLIELERPARRFRDFLRQESAGAAKGADQSQTARRPKR